jgi:hypothetical protein
MTVKILAGVRGKRVAAARAGDEVAVMALEKAGDVRMLYCVVCLGKFSFISRPTPPRLYLSTRNPDATSTVISITLGEDISTKGAPSGQSMFLFPKVVFIF